MFESFNPKFHGEWKEFARLYENIYSLPCHDCGAAFGRTHHIGCDMERYRRCRNQFLSCDCESRTYLLEERTTPTNDKRIPKKKDFGDKKELR
jgi:hypothetical protein